MSLINDALKRATKAQATPGPSSGAPMHAAAGRRPASLPRYFVPILLCVFCGAFWFIVRGWDARRQANFYPEPVTLHAREISSTSGATDPASIPYGAIPRNRKFGLNDESVSSRTISSLGGATPPSTSAPDPAGAAAEPEYRLQGIFFRPAAPSAVVNAKTVYVGDWISGARVKAIDRQSVTIEKAGETQVLTLQ